MGSIRLSKKHGLNPSITICFYCGKDAGIILPGAKGDVMAKKMGHEDGQMPMHCGVVDMNPCSECEKHMQQGIIIIGIQDGQDPNKDVNVERTGHYMVVKDRVFEGLRDIVSDQAVIDNILKQRWTFMEHAMLKKLGLLDAAKEIGETCEAGE